MAGIIANNPAVNSDDDDGEDLFAEDVMAEDMAEMQAAEEDAYESDFIGSSDDEDDVPGDAQRLREADAIINRQMALMRRKVAEEDATRNRHRLAAIDSDDSDAAPRDRFDEDGEDTDGISDDDDDERGSELDLLAGDVEDAADAASDAFRSDVDDAVSEVSSVDTDADAIDRATAVLDAVSAAPTAAALREALVDDEARRAVAICFLVFLSTPRGGADPAAPVRAAAARGSQSVEVPTPPLMEFSLPLARLLCVVPLSVLPIFHDTVTVFARRVGFDAYLRTLPRARLFCRFTRLPTADPIRSLRNRHLNCFIRITGVVTRRSPVYSQLCEVVWACIQCGHTLVPMSIRGPRETKPAKCPQCQGSGPFRVHATKTLYRNHQTCTIQEPPSDVPPGRLPRSVEVVLADDLADSLRPGQRADVLGIYRQLVDVTANARQAFPVFQTYLEANNAVPLQETRSVTLSAAERDAFREIALSDALDEVLSSSLAPAVYGHGDIKLGLLFALCGGQPKGDRRVGGHRTRGDINVLLLGDPGTAKSQMLKFVERTADRALFTTGRGSTAAGLTAAVSRDFETGEWALEGGAMVLADGGVCLIDEFDKMTENDRSAIHEAMEQQSISVAKAGIVTSLSARCSVIAAANPIGGRYDTSRPLLENVDLTPPILSRFDLIFIVQDASSPAVDAALAEFVVKSHAFHHPLAAAARGQRSTLPTTTPRRSASRAPSVGQSGTGGTAVASARAATEASELRSAVAAAHRGDPIPHTLLRKYLAFARRHFHPRLVQLDTEQLARLYAVLREEGRLGATPVSVRHLESIIRIAEARARLHLRNEVRPDDFRVSTGLFLRAFVRCQKSSARSAVLKRFAPFLTSSSDFHPVILHILNQRLALLASEAAAAMADGDDAETAAQAVQSATVRVPVAVLSEAVREAIGGVPIGPFLKSNLFTRVRTYNTHIHDIRDGAITQSSCFQLHHTRISSSTHPAGWTKSSPSGFTLLRYVM